MIFCNRTATVPPRVQGVQPSEACRSRWQGFTVTSARNRQSARTRQRSDCLQLVGTAYLTQRAEQTCTCMGIHHSRWQDAAFVTVQEYEPGAHARQRSCLQLVG
jgi:hypothetical protein